AGGIDWVQVYCPCLIRPRKNGAPCGTPVSVGKTGVGKGSGVVAAPIVLAIVAIALAIAAVLGHEAVEFFAVLGLAQVGHIFVEGFDLGVEPGAFFFQTAQLVLTIFVKSGIARRGISPAKAV